MGGMSESDITHVSDTALMVAACRALEFESGDGFVQDYYRLTNPHMFKINFTYRFGKMDASLFKRQNNKSQGEGMQGATQGMQ